MLYPDQIRNNQIQFSLTALDAARLQPVVNLPQLSPAVLREPRPREINLSGSRVLAALATAVASTGLLVWAVVRLWLFGG